jgi:hypothetical protein
VSYGRRSAPVLEKRLLHFYSSESFVTPGTVNCYNRNETGNTLRLKHVLRFTMELGSSSDWISICHRSSLEISKREVLRMVLSEGRGFRLAGAALWDFIYGKSERKRALGRPRRNELSGFVKRRGILK